MKPKDYYSFGKLNRASYLLSPQKRVNATWSVVQSRRTRILFWNCKFKGQKLQNCFTGTAIKDGKVLPESIRNKEQKKDFKSKLIAYQIEKKNQDQTFFIYQPISLGVVLNSLAPDLLQSRPMFKKL